MSYKQKLQDIERTFQYVQDNPTKAKVLGHSMLKRFNRHLDSDLFNLLVQLNALGFAEQLPKLFAEFQQKAEKLKEKTEKQWAERATSAAKPGSDLNVTQEYLDIVESKTPLLIKATQLELVNRLTQLIDDNRKTIPAKPSVKLKQSLRAYSRKHAIDCHDDTHHIDKTFDYVAQNPFKVVMFGQGVLKHFNANLNKHLFEALYQMHLVGLHKQLPDLLQRYKKAAKELEDKKVQEWSGQAMAEFNANSMLSPSVIHNNLAKIGHKELEQAKKALLVQMYWDLVVQNQQYIEAASGKAIKQSLNRYARQQQLDCRIEVARKQALYKEGQKSLHKVYEFREKTGYSPQALKQKAKERGWKQWFARVALGLAITVGIGEALVAVVFAGLPLVLGALVIGIPAFLVNFYLLKGAASGTLKEVFLGRFFKNQYGEEVSRGKKIAITGASIFVVAAGLCYGVLSFGSALSGLGGLLFGLTAAASVAAPPLGLIILAGVVATVTAVAITTLFYVSVADFIKNDRAQQLARYYKKTGGVIAADWKEGKYAHAVGRVFWEGMKAVFVVGLTALVTVCSLGKFHGKTLSLMTSFFKSPAHTATKIGYVVSVLAAPVNSLFAGKSMEACRKMVGSVAQAIKRKAVSVGSRIKTFFFGKKKPVTTEKPVVPPIPLEVSPIAKYARAKATVSMAVLAASVVANAQAQAGGMSQGTGIGSVALQKKLAHAYYIAQFAYSGVPNQLACQEECYDPVNRQTVPEGMLSEAKELALSQLAHQKLLSERSELIGEIAQGRKTPSPTTSTDMNSSDSDSDRQQSRDLRQPLLSQPDKEVAKAEDRLAVVEQAIENIKRAMKLNELKKRQDIGLFAPSAAAPAATAIDEVKYQEVDGFKRADELGDPEQPAVTAPSKPSPLQSRAALFGSMADYSVNESQSAPLRVVSAAA
ncbi:MAG: hypothetical protein P1U40_11540 [Coxiellaceae bacterium]|nr:hypothetical protein [Coxiellaceae bacterium]